MESRQHLRPWLLAFFFALLSSACEAQQLAQLTLGQAIALALGQNPDAQIALSAVADAGVNRKLARTALLPNLEFDESVTRGNDPVYVFGAKLRQNAFTQNDFALNNLNRPLPLNNFATSISGKWVAFDSWHTQFEIKRADLLAKGAEMSSTRSTQAIVLRTVRAYERLLLAEELAETARHEVETAQALLDSSVTRVDAGLSIEADQLSARAYLAERQQDLIAAHGDVAVSWAELEAAIGKSVAANQRNVLPAVAREFQVGTVDSETALALKMRPDRTSLVLQGEADRVSLRSAESSFGPQVSAFGNWETNRPSIAGVGGDNWTAGVEIRIDLLPAAKRQGLATAKIAVSRAAATQAAANREITLQVTRAYYEHEAASQMLAVARASISQTEESLRTLNDRYAAGLATMTDLMRAQDAERRSHANYAQALSRNATTYAVLKFADGTLTQDIAGDLQ